jgi:hypothetical protein
MSGGGAQVAYVADLQDMCEELQSMQSTMTEQAAESGNQVCAVTRCQHHAPYSIASPPACVML